MELRLNIGFNEIIGLIRQLPPDQKLQLKHEIDSEIKTTKTIEEKNDLTEILLSGPIMSQEEKENFKNLEKEFEKWTKNVFA